MDEYNKFEIVLNSAAKLPMVRIDRESFLRQSLSKYFDAAIVQKAIDYCPAYAGITTKQLENIAKASIGFETRKVTLISAATGVPGGIAMIGTVPADLAQYFAHVVRITQKLCYLYGWKELFDDKGQMDDETANMLTLFIGVMYCLDGAKAAITKISALVAKKVSKSLATKALTKGTIYPIIRTIAKRLCLRMTKEVFAKGVAKAIPIVGAVTSGGLTYATYKSRANKLKKYLETLNPADPEYFNKIKNEK